MEIKVSAISRYVIEKKFQAFFTYNIEKETTIYILHSREKLKNVLVRKPGRKSYYFSQFLAKISSSRISYYF